MDHLAAITRHEIGRTTSMPETKKLYEDEAIGLKMREISRFAASRQKHDPIASPASLS